MIVVYIAFIFIILSIIGIYTIKKLLEEESTVEESATERVEAVVEESAPERVEAVVDESAPEPAEAAEAIISCPLDEPVLTLIDGVQTCVTCEMNNYRKPYFNQETKRCESCPLNSVWVNDEKKCIECPLANPVLIIKEGVQTCVRCKTIDDSKPYFNQETKQCESCPSKNMRYNLDEEKCEMCPISKPKLADKYTCEMCPPKTPIVNENNECISCPEDKPRFNEDSGCEACPSDRPKLRGNDCRTCAVDNPDLPVWDKNNNTCVSCYDANPYTPKYLWNKYDNDANINLFGEGIQNCFSCVNEVDKYNTPYFNTETKKCDVCPEDKPKFNRKIKECDECKNINPYLPWWDGEACVKCPTDEKCHSCKDMFPDKPYWNEIEQKCTNIKPKIYFDFQTHNTSWTNKYLMGRAKLAKFPQLITDEYGYVYYNTNDENWIWGDF